MALVCHAGLQDSQERSRANSQGRLCWRWCLTSPGRNPALLSSNPSVFQLLECSASLLCLLLQFLESLTCLKGFLPSVHTEEERGSCLGLCSTAVSFGICGFCFSPEQRCCGGWECAADDNAEGCPGFCRAFSPFQSHNTVKQWDLMLYQCLGLLPEEQSREAK